MRGKWILAAAAVLLTVGCGSSSGGGTFAGSTISQTPAPIQTVTISPEPTFTDSGVPTESPVPAAPTLTAKGWAQGGGLNYIQQLTLAFGTVNTDAQGGDVAATGQACITLTASAAKAQAYAPVPIPAAQTHWATALADFEASGTDCSAALASSDSALATKSNNELNAGGDELSAANKILLAAP